MADELVAHIPPGQVGAWLAGDGPPIEQTLTDPRKRVQARAQRLLLRDATLGAARRLIPALENYSPSSARRLNDLVVASMSGNAEADRLLAAMLGELVKQGLA
jgi:hypothetical protein